MRRAHALFLSLIVVLLAVPVAGATANDGTVRQKLHVSAVTPDGATLNDDLDRLLGSAVVSFEYGPTTAYGSQVPATLTGRHASATVTGLESGTTYHYRAVLTLLGASVPVADATFKTLPAAATAPDDSPENTDDPDDDGDHSTSTPNGDDASGSDDGATEEAPAPVDAPKAPVLGHTVAVGPRDGKVRILKPHGRKFVALSDGANVPSGSVVDATEGTVALTSALDRHGKTQTGEFSGGKFLVRQAKHDHGMIDIYLRGSVGSCRAGVASIARKRPGRQLWGRDHHGRFRTHGATSVATVRGTHWLTEDTCAGTVTKVTTGVVAVRDRARHRTVVVRAGHSYLARRKHR